MSLNSNELNAFLRYGYIPKFNIVVNNRLDRLSSAEKFKYYSFNDAHTKLCNEIEQLRLTSPSKKLLIPCGGGFDSRVLLGIARDVVDSNQIELVTYGTPGQLDFELGAQVAYHAGIKHHKIDLNNVNWPELVKNYDGNGWYIESCVNKFSAFNQCDYSTLIGFMGDPSTGSKLPLTDRSISSTLNKYDQKNVFTKGSLQVPSTIKYFTEDIQLFPSSQLTSYEQLDFNIRQYGYIKKIFLNNENVHFPFASDGWLSIALNLTKENRKDQSWYKKFAYTNYSDLFNVGTKDTFGFNARTSETVIKILFGCHKTLSILSRKHYGLHHINSNYLNLQRKFPSHLENLQNKYLNKAFELYPSIQEYDLKDPLFRSLVASLGAEYET